LKNGTATAKSVNEYNLLHIIKLFIPITAGGHLGHDRIVVGFTTTCTYEIGA